MKTLLKLAVAIVPLALIGAFIFFSQYATRSTTFAGPSFHGKTHADAEAVAAATLDHLESSGFRPVTDAGLTGGVSMEGAKKATLMKNTGMNRQTFVIVETSDKTMQTSVKWQIRGTPGQSVKAHRDACSFALGLSEWIQSRPEANVLPETIRQDNQTWLREQIAASVN